MRELFKRVFKKEDGFSLIELIIVIAILAIIAAIAVPNLLANIARANVSTDISNAKLIADSISTAIAMDPDLEGTVLQGAAVGDPVEFVGGDVLIDAAIVVLNGNTPVIKSKDHGDIGEEFNVHLSADGVITVFGEDGTTELFPTPPTP